MRRREPDDETVQLVLHSDPEGPVAQVGIGRDHDHRTSSDVHAGFDQDAFKAGLDDGDTAGMIDGRSLRSLLALRTLRTWLTLRSGLALWTSFALRTVSAS